LGVDTVLLLVGFGFTKLGIAAAIIWLGLRTGERPDDGDDFGGPPPEPRPPRLPSRRGRRSARGRGGPARSPSPRAGRVRA
jgi:hypothetical protein